MLKHAPTLSLSGEVRFEASRVPCSSIISLLTSPGDKGVNGLHPGLEEWKAGRGTRGKLTACYKKRRWEAKPHRSEGDRDLQQYQLRFEADGHSHNEMQPASQTLSLTEAESVTFMHSSVSLSSLSFPGHQNC